MDREVFFEFVALGGTVKCTAIDGATGVEASIVGPAAAMQRDLERLALRALERRLARDRGTA